MNNYERSKKYRDDSKALMPTTKYIDLKTENKNILSETLKCLNNWLDDNLIFSAGQDTRDFRFYTLIDNDIKQIVLICKRFNIETKLLINYDPKIRASKLNEIYVKCANEYAEQIGMPKNLSYFKVGKCKNGRIGYNDNYIDLDTLNDINNPKSGYFYVEFKNHLIKIKKVCVKFKGNIGTYSRELTKEEMKELCPYDNYIVTLSGLVNKKYKEVFECKGCYSRIEIFNDDNFIVTKRISGGDGEQAYTRDGDFHYKYKNGKVTEGKELDGSGYVVIDNNHIIIKANFWGKGYEAIYDVEKGELSSYKFSKIEEFSSIDGSLVARAVLKLVSNDGNKSTHLTCYIYKTGTIVSDVYSTYSNKIYSDYSTAIFEELCSINRDAKIRNESEEQLIKTIRH
jgi:hypothetical protein